MELNDVQSKGCSSSSISLPTNDSDILEEVDGNASSVNSPPLSSSSSSSMTEGVLIDCCCTEENSSCSSILPFNDSSSSSGGVAHEYVQVCIDMMSKRSVGCSSPFALLLHLLSWSSLMSVYMLKRFCFNVVGCVVCRRSTVSTLATPPPSSDSFFSLIVSLLFSDGPFVFSPHCKGDDKETVGSSFVSEVENCCTPYLRVGS
mmetsp:Transcript_46872/g.52920  ORF Transcript_46872/g.52920 Transcript_46872/m.52920 type:complete len:203 (-) Transcript_46872:452-1060(-)